MSWHIRRSSSSAVRPIHDFIVVSIVHHAFQQWSQDQSSLESCVWSTWSRLRSRSCHRDTPGMTVGIFRGVMPGGCSSSPVTKWLAELAMWAFRLPRMRGWRVVCRDKLTPAEQGRRTLEVHDAGSRRSTRTITNRSSLPRVDRRHRSSQQSAVSLLIFFSCRSSSPSIVDGITDAISIIATGGLPRPH